MHSPVWPGHWDGHGGPFASRAGSELGRGLRGVVLAAVGSPGSRIDPRVGSGRSNVNDAAISVVWMEMGAVTGSEGFPPGPWLEKLCWNRRAGRSGCQESLCQPSPFFQQLLLLSLDLCSARRLPGAAAKMTVQGKLGPFWHREAWGLWPPIPLARGSSPFFSDLKWPELSNSVSGSRCR